MYEVFEKKISFKNEALEVWHFRLPMAVDLEDPEVVLHHLSS